MGESGAEADVRVHVRPRVVQVQRAQPGIRAVVPVAAEDRKPSRYFQINPVVSWSGNA